MTTPPRDNNDDDDDKVYPYGPPVPAAPINAAPVTSTPTTAETLALIDAEFVPDEESRRVTASIRGVKVLGVLALVGGAIGMFAAVIDREFGESRPSTLVFTSIVLLVVVCATPVWLLVLGRRHRQRLVTRSIAASATAWGFVLLVLGLMAVGPTLVTTAAAEIRDAIARTRPVTAGESAYSPADLAVEYQKLVDRAASAGGGVAKAGSEHLVRENYCELSNLDYGRALSGTNFYLTALSAEDALDAIEAAWNTDGYVTERYGEGEYPITDYEDPGYLDHDDPMVTTDGVPFTWASAYVYDGYDAEGQLRLYVDYKTICVAK